MQWDATNKLNMYLSTSVTPVGNAFPIGLLLLISTAEENLPLSLEISHLLEQPGSEDRRVTTVMVSPAASPGSDIQTECTSCA